jgi:hypothetical protein
MQMSAVSKPPRVSFCSRFAQGHCDEHNQRHLKRYLRAEFATEAAAVGCGFKFTLSGSRINDAELEQLQG